MSEEKSVIEATGFFNGYKTKGNFDIELNFKFPEEQLANALQFMAGIGKRIKMFAIIGTEKVVLGTFGFYDFKVDRDANSSLRLKSHSDSCMVNNFNQLMVDEETPIVLKAKIVEE